MLIHLRIVYGCCTAAIELNSCNRDNMNDMAAKPKILTVWPFLENVDPWSNPLRFYPWENQGQGEVEDLPSLSHELLDSCASARSIVHTASWFGRVGLKHREKLMLLCTENHSQSVLDHQVDPFCHGGNCFWEVKDQHWNDVGSCPPLCCCISWGSSNPMLSFLQLVNRWMGRGCTSN